MLCPFHLGEIGRFIQESRGKVVICRCPSCKEEIPLPYIKEYHLYPPVVISAVGFRGHGKTVYFASLFYTIKLSRLPKIWNKLYTEALNEESFDTVNRNMEMLKRGELPPSTAKNFPRPTIIRVNGVPLYPPRTLLFYDTSGEAFERPTQLVQYANFVAYSRTAMFLLSPCDLKNAPEEMHNLINVYSMGLGQLNGDTNKQDLVVVYTKADELVPLFKDYPELLSYLQNGTIDGLSDVQGYIRKLHHISHLLKKFTRETLGANEFLNFAEQRFKSVNFCIVSSLGARPEGGRIPSQILPKRVLDPILWLMEKSLHPLKQRFRALFI